MAQAGATMTSIYLERREPAHHRQRFYAITVTRTRFGSWALVREWGRIGPPGTVREMEFATEGAAGAAGEQVRRREERRSYHVVVETGAATDSGGGPRSGSDERR